MMDARTSCRPAISDRSLLCRQAPCLSFRTTVVGRTCRLRGLTSAALPRPTQLDEALSLMHDSLDHEGPPRRSSTRSSRAAKQELHSTGSRQRSHKLAPSTHMSPGLQALLSQPHAASEALAHKLLQMEEEGESITGQHRHTYLDFAADDAEEAAAALLLVGSQVHRLSSGTAALAFQPAAQSLNVHRATAAGSASRTSLQLQALYGIPLPSAAACSHARANSRVEPTVLGHSIRAALLEGGTMCVDVAEGAGAAEIAFKALAKARAQLLARHGTDMLVLPAPAEGGWHHGGLRVHSSTGDREANGRQGTLHRRLALFAMPWQAAEKGH